MQVSINRLQDNPLTWRALNERFTYDPNTGVLKYTGKVYRTHPNKTVGALTDEGYRRIKINHKVYMAHRIIWALAYNEIVPDMIDHIDGDRDNNRLENLRKADASINGKNTKTYSTNISGVVGVSWAKVPRKWMASASIDKRLTNLGYYEDFFEAVAVRKSAEITNGYHINHGR